MPTAMAAIDSTSIRRVLVIFPGALGDLICLVPAVRAIARRNPDATLELMARGELARFAVGRLGFARGHSIDRRETDSNFGFNLPWWDRLFGTYRPQPALGHTGMVIGIDRFRSPRDLWLHRMLVQPLRGPSGR